MGFNLIFIIYNLTLTLKLKLKLKLYQIVLYY